MFKLNSVTVDEVCSLFHQIKELVERYQVIVTWQVSKFAYASARRVLSDWVASSKYAVGVL